MCLVLREKSTQVFEKTVLRKIFGYASTYSLVNAAKQRDCCTQWLQRRTLSLLRQSLNRLEPSQRLVHLLTCFCSCKRKFVTNKCGFLPIMNDGIYCSEEVKSVHYAYVSYNKEQSLLTRKRSHSESFVT